MTEDLVPYTSQQDTELFRGNFQVPSDWKSCGPAIHVAGAPGLITSQLIALALNKTSLTLCTQEGPALSVPLGSIRDVKVEDLTGVSIPVNTPTGAVDMVPPQAKGVAVSYVLSPMGTISKLILFTMTLSAAHEWVHEILSAVHRKSSDLGKSAQISRR